MEATKTEAGSEPEVVTPLPSDPLPTTDQLQKLLAVATHGKEAAEANVDQVKKEMDVKVLHMETDVMNLKSEILDWQKRLTEKDIEIEKLTTKLKLKETVFSEKEEMLRVRAEEAEKLLIAFKDDFDRSGKTMTANEKFDVMELRGQLVVQRKKVQSLEMNVKSAELELGAKIKVDTKKTELIALLDKKLAQQNDKISYLLTTAETLVKEKETQAKKLVTACEELTKLSQRCVDNEKVSNELRRNNTQLKKMLNSLDGKGQQIAGLAKEKVKTYSDKNKKLQEEVDSLKQDKNAGNELLSSQIKTLEQTFTTSCSDILAKITTMSQKDTVDAQCLEELNQIQANLKSLQETKLKLEDSLETSKSNEYVEKLNERNIELSTQLTTLKQENDQLREASTPQDQSQEDNSNIEKLNEELNAKDKELERLTTELGAIRSLVLGATSK